MRNLAALSIAFVLMSGCQSPRVQHQNTLSVAATFYPLAFIAREVGGDHVSVLQVTPGGVEPHDFEPSPTQLADVHRTKIFLMNGAGIDAWADKIRDELIAAGIVTIDMTEHLPVLSGFVEEGLADPTKTSSEHPAVIDPHVWLDPMNMTNETVLVRDAFITADPDNAEAYRQNAQRLLTNLATLDREYADGLATCKVRFAVVSHNAFRYMAARYKFESLAISGLSPEEEPSAKRIAELADIAKQHGIAYIFFETLVSPKLAETVATEIGAQSLVLNPIEGLTPANQASGETYLTIMRQNLHNLRTAMQCQ